MSSTLSIARGAHAQLRVVIVTLLGKEHRTALTMRDINKELLDNEMELEEYNPR